MTFRVLISTAALCAALLCVPVHGYVLNGSWKSGTPGYYVNPANADMPEDAALVAIQNGAAAWGAQSQAAFSFYYMGLTNGTTVGNNGRNEVFFRNSTNGAAAATTYTYYSSGHIVDSDIVIWDAAYPFYAGSSGCSGSGVYLQDAITHEFGHAAGIAHSDVAEATMYAYIRYCGTTMRTLAADDQGAIEALYPTAGTVAAPMAPSVAVASPAAANPASSIEVTWNDVSNEDAYTIERSADGVTFGPAGSVAANTTTYVDAGLSAGRTYYYRISAANSGGASGYSPIASATTDSGTSAASSLSLTAAGSRTKGTRNVTLTWTGAASASVDIYLGDVMIETTPNDGSTVDSVSSRGTYTYRVCESGSTTCSNLATVVF